MADLIRLNAISLTARLSGGPVEVPRLFATDVSEPPQLIHGEYFPAPLEELVAYRHKDRLRVRLIGSASDPEGTELLLPDCPVKSDDSLLHVFFRSINHQLYRPFLIGDSAWLNLDGANADGRLCQLGLERDVASVFRAVGYRHGLTLTDGIAFFPAMVGECRLSISCEPHELIARGSLAQILPFRSELAQLLEKFAPALFKRNWRRRWDAHTVPDPVARLQNLRRNRPEAGTVRFFVFVRGEAPSGHLAMEDLGILDEMSKIVREGRC